MVIQIPGVGLGRGGIKRKARSMIVTDRYPPCHQKCRYFLETQLRGGGQVSLWIKIRHGWSEAKKLDRLLSCLTDKALEFAFKCKMNNFFSKLKNQLKLRFDLSDEPQVWEQLAILNQENMSIDSKMEKSIFFNHLLKVLNHKISIETSQFMLNLYLKLSLTSFKNKFQQKQLALYKSSASAQSGNPEQSWTFSCLEPVAACQKLNTLKQEPDETLKGFMQQVLNVATDGYGYFETTVLQQMATEAFLRGCRNKESASLVLISTPKTIQEACQRLKTIVANKKALEGPKVSFQERLFSAQEEKGKKGQRNDIHGEDEITWSWVSIWGWP